MGLIDIIKPLSTFLLAAPIINLNNMDNFFLWKFLGMLGIEPRAAGSGRKAFLCRPLPPFPPTLRKRDAAYDYLKHMDNSERLLFLTRFLLTT